MCSARSWSRAAWARSASSPRPAPASTASPPRRCARGSGSNASSIWARSTSSGSSPTCSAWRCWAPRSIPVQSGTRTLKDAMNEALRDWVTNVHNTFYCIGTVAGPHPYPMMVRDFQSIIGNETREQMQEAEGRLPDSLVACIGGGSNAMGLFHPFLDDPSRRDLWRRGRGPRPDAAACGLDRRRPARRAARQPHLSADGRRRPDPGRAFDLGGARLSRHRAGAFLAARDRPRHLSQRHRRRGAGRVPVAVAAGRHHPRAGIRRMPSPR